MSWSCYGYSLQFTWSIDGPIRRDIVAHEDPDARRGLFPFHNLGHSVSLRVRAPPPDGLYRIGRWDREFADSPLEHSGFELPVPLSRNGPPAAPAGSPCSNRRDRADAAVVLTPKVGPAVRIRFPPATSPQTLGPSVIRILWWDQRFESAFLQQPVCLSGWFSPARRAPRRRSKPRRASAAPTAPAKMRAAFAPVEAGSAESPFPVTVLMPAARLQTVAPSGRDLRPIN
jgi:hypothetical protein